MFEKQQIDEAGTEEEETKMALEVHPSNESEFRKFLCSIEVGFADAV